MELVDCVEERRFPAGQTQPSIDIHLRQDRIHHYKSPSTHVHLPSHTDLRVNKLIQNRCNEFQTARIDECISLHSPDKTSNKPRQYEFSKKELDKSYSKQLARTKLLRSNLDTHIDSHPSEHDAEATCYLMHDRYYPDVTPRPEQNQTHSRGRWHQVSCQPNLRSNLMSAGTTRRIPSKQYRCCPLNLSKAQIILTIFIMNAVMDQLSNHLTNLQTRNFEKKSMLRLSQILPSVLIASATDINAVCREDSDCDDMRCYQGKCICPKDRPIEDRGLCLPSALITESCSISDQCLGNSICLEGYCSCGPNAIALFNPSTRIDYCHPKRRLNEECSHDAQCPNNSFCSTNKCLCQNGYGSSTVKSSEDIESTECLAKRCTTSSDCESEYHVCSENRCLCLADHFDPHTAGCYKFGSTGGKSSGNQTNEGPSTSSSNNDSTGKGFNQILKDLMKNSDKLWYIIIIVVVLTILLLTLIVMSLRRYFLGYCWTAHKKEYEPNNKSAPKSGYFNKNSINNKSFRQKNGETDDDGGDDNDDTAADRSNLVTTVNKSRGALLTNGNHRRVTNNKEHTDGGNHYVKVDIGISSEDQQNLSNQDDSTNEQDQTDHRKLFSRPLPTSNSTAV